MLYTIGSSNRSPDDFFGVLKSMGVTRVIDVRSKPRSRLEHFRHPEVMLRAAEYGLRYAWQGKVLGGLCETRIDDPDFARIADMVIDLSATEEVAIFCAEGDPTECHRHGKVGLHALVRHGMIAKNILRNNKVEDSTKTMLRTPVSFIDMCTEGDVISRNAAYRLSAEAEGLPEPDNLPKNAIPYK